MAKRSLTDETIDGMAWQSLSIGANILLRAIILILLARTLHAVEFGVIAAAVLVTNIGERISQIGVSRVLVQRLEIDQNVIRDAFAISLWSGVLATIAVALAAPLFSSLFRIDHLDPYIEFLALTLLINNLSAIPAALLQRDRRFRALGLIGLSSYVLGFGLVALPMALMGFGAWSLAAAEMVQVCTRFLTLFAMRRPAMGLWPGRAGSRELLNVGSGFSAGQVGNFIATQVDYLIVGRWLGAEALGFYNRAYQFLMLPTQLLGSAISVVLFPSLAAIQDQPERVARAYLRALGTIAMLAFPASGVLIIIAPELVRFLLGSEWTAMTLPFQILISTLLFRTSYKISDSASLAMGSMYQRAWRQWIYAAAVAIGAYVGTRWGISGVAVGVGAAVVLNFTLMLMLARRVTSITMGPIARVHLRHLAIGMITSVPVWLAAQLSRSSQLPDFAVLANGLLAATLSALLLWFCFRGLFGEDGAWLHKILSARLRSAFDRQAAN
jgi:PST family polysaccharide transporter